MITTLKRHDDVRFMKKYGANLHRLHPTAPAAAACRMKMLGSHQETLGQASLARAVTPTVSGLVPGGMTTVALLNPDTPPLLQHCILDDHMPNNTAVLIAASEGADTLLIETPDHSRTIHGGLKNAINWLSRASLNPQSHEPVTIWSLS